jgi:DNA-binding LacI/PurR family transcriptional regulator
VREVAEQLGYVPRRSARSLRSGRSGTIGLLSPAVGDRPSDDELTGLDFYMRLTAAVARAAFEHDHTVQLLPHTRDPRRLRDAELDGALLSDPEPGDPVMAALRDAGIPVVTLEQDPDRPEHPWSVRADHERATRALLDHFARQGARAPALLVPDVPWAWIAQIRAAYLEWCERKGATPRIAAVASDGPGARAAAAELLAPPSGADAIYAVAERYGRGVLAAAQEAGLRVPEDVLVASGVDSPLALAADPPLTAVDLAPERQGEAAVELLLARLDGREGDPVVVDAKLNVRASSRR